MAAASVAVVGEEVCLGPFVATFGQCSEGIDEVTTWATRIHSSPGPQGSTHSLSVFSCVGGCTCPSLSHRTCRCGRLLDQFSHHRAAYSKTKVLGRRGFPLECAAAQVCREGGARVTTKHVCSRHELGCSQRSGQPQIGSCGGRVDPLAGSATRHRHHVGVSSAEPGQPITTARLWKMLDAGKRPLTPNFPVKVGELASWSWQLKWVERGDSAIPHRTGESSRPGGATGSARRAETAWVKRWSAILACTAARAFTVSLLDRRPVSGTGERSLQSKRF